MCTEAPSLSPVKKQRLPPYKHSWQRLKNSSVQTIDSKPNGSRLRLGHLQVGDDVIDKHCRAGIQMSTNPVFGSSGSHCTK